MAVSPHGGQPAWRSITNQLTKDKGARHVGLFLSDERMQPNYCINPNEILLNNKDQQILIVGCAMWRSLLSTIALVCYVAVANLSFVPTCHDGECVCPLLALCSHFGTL